MMKIIRQENKSVRLAIAFLSFISIVGSATINPLYLLFFAGYFFVVLFSKIKGNEKIIWFCVYSLFSAIIILVIEFVIAKFALKNTSNNLDSFILSFVTTLVLFFPLQLIKLNIKKAKNISLTQKAYYNIPEKFPDLICDMHFSRTVEKSVLGYKIVHCKKSKKCFSLGRITHVKTLIGVIGDYQRSWKFEDEYSTMIWDNENKKIIDGDFDIIEIREGLQMQDYNAAVSKVVSFLYNQVKRSKPISEMLVRIAGNPALSESTKRLLEERFLKVEYLELNYRKLNYTL